MCFIGTYIKILPSSCRIQKIEKTVTQFLTPDQYNRLIWHLSDQPDSSMGPRNLIIIMLHITAKQDFVEVITA